MKQIRQAFFKDGNFHLVLEDGTTSYPGAATREFKEPYVASQTPYSVTIRDRVVRDTCMYPYTVIIKSDGTTWKQAYCTMEEVHRFEEILLEEIEWDRKREVEARTKEREFELRGKLPDNPSSSGAPNFVGIIIMLIIGGALFSNEMSPNTDEAIDPPLESKQEASFKPTYFDLNPDQAYLVSKLTEIIQKGRNVDYEVARRNAIYQLYNCEINTNLKTKNEQISDCMNQLTAKNYKGYPN